MVKDLDHQLTQVIGKHQQKHGLVYPIAAAGAPVYFKVGNQANETIPRTYQINYDPET